MASLALAKALSSASGRLTLAKARLALTLTLKIVRGARLRLLTDSPSASPLTSLLPFKACPNAPPSVESVAGNDLTMLATCAASLAKAPRSISEMPSRVTCSRLDGLAPKSRPVGSRSRITWPSATAAWPSTAAWWNCEYSPTRLRPLAPGARPSSTWNFHSGLLRSSSTGCSLPTAASISALPSPWRADAGSLTSTMWAFKSGSASTQAGLARFSGIHHKRRRSTGANGKRVAMWRRKWTTNLPLNPAGNSNTCSAPTCIGISGLSRYRKLASRLESCSMVR